MGGDEQDYSVFMVIVKKQRTRPFMLRALSYCFLDPTGYVFLGTIDEILQIKDVTTVGVSDSSEGGESRIASDQYALSIAVFPPPYSYLAVTLQHTGLE